MPSELDDPFEENGTGRMKQNFSFFPNLSTEQKICHLRQKLERTCANRRVASKCSAARKTLPCVPKDTCVKLSHLGLDYLAKLRRQGQDCHVKHCF